MRPRINIFIPLCLVGLLAIHSLRAQEEAREDSEPPVTQLAGTPGRIDGKTPAERAAALVRYASKLKPKDELYPKAAASAFATRDDGLWLRTGDVGVVDADGFITIVDRSKDMIAVGGFKVFPSQVEHVLLQHQAVKEALVIGVKDEYRGEVPRAYVTLAGEATAEGLRDWLNERVGKHERVDAVVLRESLPKTMIGKLDRKALRAEVL